MEKSPVEIVVILVAFEWNVRCSGFDRFDDFRSVIFQEITFVVGEIVIVGVETIVIWEDLVCRIVVFFVINAVVSGTVLRFVTVEISFDGMQIVDRRRRHTLPTQNDQTQQQLDIPSQNMFWNNNELPRLTRMKSENKKIWNQIFTGQ